MKVIVIGSLNPGNQFIRKHLSLDLSKSSRSSADIHIHWLSKRECSPTFTVPGQNLLKSADLVYLRGDYLDFNKKDCEEEAFYNWYKQLKGCISPRCVILPFSGMDRMIVSKQYLKYLSEFTLPTLLFDKKQVNNCSDEVQLQLKNFQKRFGCVFYLKSGFSTEKKNHKKTKNVETAWRFIRNEFKERLGNSAVILVQPFIPGFLEHKFLVKGDSIYLEHEEENSALSVFVRNLIGAIKTRRIFGTCLPQGWRLDLLFWKQHWYLNEIECVGADYKMQNFDKLKEYQEIITEEIQKEMKQTKPKKKGKKKTIFEKTQ